MDLQNLKKLLAGVGTQAKAIAAQVNPDDNGATYNTVRYQAYQKQNPGKFPTTYATKPANQKVWEDDALVNTSRGVVMPLNAIDDSQPGPKVQWQNPSNGYSPTGYVSPSYSAAADAWTHKDKSGFVGRLFR